MNFDFCGYWHALGQLISSPGPTPFLQVGPKSGPARTATRLIPFSVSCRFSRGRAEGGGGGSRGGSRILVKGTQQSFEGGLSPKFT